MGCEARFTAEHPWVPASQGSGGWFPSGRVGDGRAATLVPLPPCRRSAGVRGSAPRCSLSARSALLFRGLRSERGLFVGLAGGVGAAGLGAAPAGLCDLDGGVAEGRADLVDVEFDDGAFVAVAGLE
jgi:hypothetical protein